MTANNNITKQHLSGEYVCYASWTKRIVLMAIVGIFLLPGISSVMAQDKNSDGRISLNLTPVEKSAFLAEMRQMLASIQGIMAGIGEENRELIINSARQSGHRMARATPETVRSKLPPAFKELGGPTHMMFEEIVVRAETDDMNMLASQTGQLMKQCLACHAMFKTD